ncbi:MAG: hypothetical protein M3116_00565 [Actinomycetota bacterium]|nr:hypothetical protein [Actinomycetota bacterium]
MRIVAETVLGVVLTLLLAVAVAGLLAGLDRPNPAEAFLREGPALLFGAFWIAIVLWVILVGIGNVVHRNRRPRARVLHNLLSALAVSVLNVIVLTVIGATAGGFGMLLVGIAVVAAIAFLVGAAIAVPLTHLVLFRPRTPAATPATPAAPIAH